MNMTKKKAETAAATKKPLTAAEKMPDLWKEFSKVKAEKEKLDKAVAPLRAKRDKIAAEELAPIEVKMKKLGDEIKSHMPEMVKIDQRLAALARAMQAQRALEAAGA
jgi:peptidoglycan hydrolase CwlO-like protein